MWTCIAQEKDEELAGLAEGLLDTVLASRADSTTKKYISAFRRWKQWASSKDLSTTPRSAGDIALYLQHVDETSKSKAAVEGAVYAISWVQS